MRCLEKVKWIPFSNIIKKMNKQRINYKTFNKRKTKNKALKINKWIKLIMKKISIMSKQNMTKYNLIRYHQKEVLNKIISQNNSQYTNNRNKLKIKKIYKFKKTPRIRNKMNNYYSLISKKYRMIMLIL